MTVPSSPPHADLHSGEAFARWERTHFHSHLLWLLPAAFAVHIAEEAPSFSGWVSVVLGGAMDTFTFVRNNVCYMALSIALTIWASRSRARFALACLFFWVSGQMFWNAVFHVYTEHHFHAYSPGFFTAVFVYFPVYGYLGYVALRERFLRKRAVAVGLLGGAFGMFFTIWAGLYHFESFPFERWH